MPTDLPSHAVPALSDRRAQVALLTDALATDDAFIVTHALREIASAQGQASGLGDDPALSAVLAAAAALGLELTARPRE